jgi:hypothetical protein
LILKSVRCVSQPFFLRRAFGHWNPRSSRTKRTPCFINAEVPEAAVARRPRSFRYAKTIVGMDLLEGGGLTFKVGKKASGIES